MTDEIQQLTAAVNRDVIRTMPEWPGGWTGQAEAAVIDSVCSIQARYGGPDTGVRRQVKDWQAHRGVEKVDDLAELVRFAEWNESRGRPLRSKVAGRLKAEVIADVAGRFAARGVTDARGLLDTPEAESIWQATPGLGYATWRYVLLLLGTPTVKPDTMLVRYVSRAIGRHATPREVTDLVTECAGLVNQPAHLLDHAIWQFERKRAQ